MQADNKFSYSAQPHAAPLNKSASNTATTNSRPKYRDDNGENNNLPQNIMHDSRVVRGNTYSAKVLSSSLKQELDKSQTGGSPLTKRFPRKKDTRRSYGTKRSSTPPPVEGRSHVVMQTEDFLEELTDRPIEQDAETQTQTIMDRPASPLFVRAKIGFDVYTQIENGDLFDFNSEVEPILEVLVGKTLHVAMLEIMQEEELEAIRLQQEEFETIRNVELAEVQRLEAEIKRKAQEKERRLGQEKKRLEDRRRLEETIAARQFSQQFLGELHNSVFDMLEKEGHFYDPVQREIEELFMGNLLNGVAKGAACYEAASIIVMELLEQARLKAKAFDQECKRMRQAAQEKKENEERERKQREEEERQAKEAAERAALEEVAGELEVVPPPEE